MTSYAKLHLDADEHVIMEVRKHWIVFAGYAISLLFAALLPCVMYVLAETYASQLFKNFTFPSNFPAIFLFFYCLWLLFLWASFFVQWTKYYLDVWYVTEKRIIDVDQKRIFDREISNLRFDKIQDITIDVQGFFSTLLGFGTIRVETAGEDNMDFIMDTVSHPDEVRRVIFSQHNEIGDTPLEHARSNTPGK